jgi:hypothetical protein
MWMGYAQSSAPAAQGPAIPGVAVLLGSLRSRKSEHTRRAYFRDLAPCQV